MNFEDFKKYQLFVTAGGGTLWLVTDVGTRVVVAARLHMDPPRLDPEVVFDDGDFGGCQLL